MDTNKYLPFWLKEAKLTQERRNELQLVLENEGEFYKQFLASYNTQQARMCIEAWLAKNRLSRYHANAYDRELMSQYFRQQWNVDLERHHGDASWLFDKFNLKEADVALNRPPKSARPCDEPHPSFTPPPENLMTKLIKIESRVFVNGTDVSNYADADLYNLIAEQEKAIGELEKIQTKPKRLQNEINERRAGIEALVKMLDERDTATSK